ncbi:hypothetical protein BC834DRAFT_65624 [Gloeopeniophorella convolvens]|nr:hypothetical protein BC834DRAFT_65624 [Gloeopeniophorella convolvens]
MPSDAFFRTVWYLICALCITIALLARRLPRAQQCVLSLDHSILLPTLRRAGDDCRSQASNSLFLILIRTTLSTLLLPLGPLILNL